MSPLPPDWAFARPGQLSRLTGMTTDSIRRLIKAKELEAVNFSSVPNRPRYRISRAAFDRFVALRATVTAA